MEKKNKIEILGRMKEGYESILTYEALAFLESLHLKFNETRKSLLKERHERQKEIRSGKLPNFLEETKDIRESDWLVAPVPDDIKDRRVEITGPVDSKMVINALNSGAKVFMADFEDANSPSWDNTINGQINLRNANNNCIDFFDEKSKKHYSLKKKHAILFVRARGWHLDERHLKIEGENLSGAMVDFGLYFFHNVHTLLKNNRSPYFYLPKIEYYKEARLWNDIFVYAQNYLNIPQKTIKATALIETLTASFQLDEILYELRDHSAGLNCGRWDYMFSYIKNLCKTEGYVLPDRAQVTMNIGFMDAYSKRVIQVCHRRNIHAMGGMAAQIPIKNDETANNIAIEKVRADKLREVQNGHDGTWVAHPGLVPVAMNIFNEYMKTDNQIDKKLDDLNISATDLLSIPKGDITEEGLRNNINVAIIYIEKWLQGSGAVAIYNLMEDTATAEISRTQVWQWINQSSKLSDGRVVTDKLCDELIEEELVKIKEYVGVEYFDQGKFHLATELFKNMIHSDELEEFLTLVAYDYLD